MSGQTPAGGKGSNKVLLVCLLALVLAFGGCVAYSAVQGSKDGSAQPASTAGGGTPTTAAPATSTAAGPAQMLADLDGDMQPVTVYQAALDALAPKCTQDEAFIAGLGDTGYKDLVKHGIMDETRLTVLQHLDASIPPGLGKTDCTRMLSAYLVLSEGG